MADEGGQVTNGNGKNGYAARVKERLAIIIAVTVMACVFGEAGVAYTAARWGVNDWTTVNSIAGNMNGLALVLAGALAVLAKPTGSE